MSSVYLVLLAHEAFFFVVFVSRQAYHLIMSSHKSDQTEKRASAPTRTASTRAAVADSMFDSDDDGEEEEEIPEDITHLSPEEQQKIIKWRAFKILTIGTVMVIYFSDPMVDVMQEIAVKAGISPFYVSFVLAPLASNASEVVASMFYAAKKTRKTMTVSLSALEGAACMNNTFWYVVLCVPLLPSHRLPSGLTTIPVLQFVNFHVAHLCPWFGLAIHGGDHFYCLCGAYHDCPGEKGCYDHWNSDVGLAYFSALLGAGCYPGVLWV